MFTHLGNVRFFQNPGTNSPFELRSITVDDSSPFSIRYLPDGNTISLGIASSGLGDLVYGNGIDVTSITRYNPAVGANIATQRNIKDKDGHVVRGDTPFVPAVVRKVWGTDANDDPHWRETVIFRGGNQIDIELTGIENGIKVYTIHYVPFP